MTTPTPSDTPRVDAIFPLGSMRNPELPHITGVLAGFARQLERELAEARADAERLDWMLKLWPLEIVRLVHSYHTHGPTSSEPRAAIDAAMKEGK